MSREPLQVLFNLALVSVVSPIRDAMAQSVSGVVSLRGDMRILAALIAGALLACAGFVFLRYRHGAFARRRTSAIIAALDEHAIVSIADARGRITYANDKFCRISGYPREELLGRTHALLKSGEHADDFYREMWETIGAGRPWHGEIKNRTKSGDFYWVAATIVPDCDARGVPLQYVSIRTEITAQKEFEHRLHRSRAFVEGLAYALGEGVLAVDAAGRCTFMNREAERLLGWSAEEFVGMDVHEKVHAVGRLGERVEAGQCPVRRVLGDGVSVDRIETDFVRRNGELFPIALSARPLFESGRNVGAVIAFRDISADKEREADLHRARERAEQADRTKSMFLANISHEIRTPMNAVIGFSDLCLRTELPPPIREYVRMINDAGNALMALIDEILDFSKIEAGHAPLDRIEFEISQVLSNVAALVARKAAAKGLELTFGIPASLPSHVVGDPARLRQVLTNLLDNAIKFTLNGRVRLDVREVRADAQTTELAFVVSDTGIGLSSEHQARLFLPFSQADSSTTRRFGGTGLGLAICRRIADQMGGALSVNSTLGAGAQFEFSVPFGRATSARADAVPPYGRTLVADDAPHSRIALAEAVAPLATEVHQVGGGQDAIDLVHAFVHAGTPFATLVVDRDMPGVDGIGVARALAALPEAARPVIVLVSRIDTPADRAAARAAGVRGFAVQPVTTFGLRRLAHETGLAQPVAPLPVAAPPANPPAPARAERARVLLVEDNEVNRVVAIAMLEQAGAQVTTAADGREAVDLLSAAAARGESWDVVLMDVHMPRLDGHEATRLLRADPRFASLPIVAMTADAMADERARCLDAGMNDFIAKPVRAHELTEIIARWRRR